MKFLAIIVPLLVTTASAQPWAQVNVPTTASLRGISVVNDKVVWASGAEGTVIRTLDGGKTWAALNVEGGRELDFRGIHAFDASNAVIISSGPAEKGQARIYRTSNGGRSWKRVLEEKTPGVFLDAIAFWDRRRGIVLSDPVGGRFVLFTTGDGGATWQQIPAAALPAALPNEGAFAASNSCLTVQGKRNAWFATCGAAVARVFRSTDGGRSWRVNETDMHPANSSSGIFSVAFPARKHGLAAGGDYQHPQSSDLPSLMRSADGGTSWRAAESTQPNGMYLSSVVEARDRGRTYVLGAGIGGLFFGPSGGSLKKESDVNLNAVAGTGAKVGLPWWAVGAKGMVLKRTESVRPD
jgi:photosystem II stability/assembly factor-like uncharacterized protein